MNLYVYMYIYINVYIVITLGCIGPMHDDVTLKVYYYMYIHSLVCTFDVYIYIYI
jgi:molybdopterin-biosynthesis enzyme MoeA-like protein